jgi:hypothetical protein
MKKFLLKVIITLSSFYVILYFLDYIVEEGIKNSNNEEMPSWNQLFSGSINDDLVIMGSSRAYVHFDPKAIERLSGISTYNLGLNGSRFYSQKAKLDWYLKFNKKPKVLIWVVDLHSFELAEETMRIDKIIPYSHVEEVKDFFFRTGHYTKTLELIPFSRFTLISKQLFYTGLANSLLGYTSPTTVYKGYKKNTSNWNDDRLRSIKINNPDGLKINLDNKIIEDFKMTCQILKNLEIKVVLVFTPMHENGLSIYNNYENILQEIGQVAEDINVPFLNYSRSEINADTLNFYNAMHLNQTGVEKFMPVFVRDLEEILKH